MHSFLEEMNSIHPSKYLRLRLHKMMKRMNGMKLCLDRFSGGYLMLRLAQELVKIALEKTFDSLFSMFCSKTNLDNLKHVLRLAYRFCFPFFRFVKCNFIQLPQNALTRWLPMIDSGEISAKILPTASKLLI